MLGGLGAVGLLLVLAQIEAGAEVTTEASGGQAPVLPGEAPRGGVTATLRPAGEARVRLRGDTLNLRLQYSPQLYWRYPNRLDSGKPLVLHNGAFSATSALSSRTRVGTRATLSAGEADYAALPRLLGTTQGALPDAVELLMATGSLDVEHDLTQRWKLAAELTYTHRRPLNQAETAMLDPGMPMPIDPGEFLLARQNALLFRPVLSHRLTPVDELLFDSGVAWESHSTGIELYRWQPRAGWRRRLEPGQALTFEGGVAYTHEVGTRLATGERNSVSPVAEGRYDGRLWRTSNLTLQGSFGLQVEHYVDPVLATAGPRGLIGAEVNLLMGQSWTVGLETLFGTGLQGDPLVGQPDETFVAASIPVRHRASPYLILEAGVRYSDRGPHLAADQFDWHQRELWFYVAATATTFPVPAWRAQEPTTAPASAPAPPPPAPEPPTPPAPSPTSPAAPTAPTWSPPSSPPSSPAGSPTTP